MIKPLDECETSHAFFVGLDIENYPDGRVLTITPGWREDHGNIVTKRFTSWGEFWKWLLPVAREDKRFRTIYAHNGGGWDWLSLVQFLLTDGAKDYLSLYASTAASKMITLTVKMESRFSVHFCDSLQLLRSPLAKLAEKFGVTRKVDIGDKLPHEIYETDPAKYEQYRIADVESLIEILEKSLSLVREHVAKIDTFGYTIGSTALKIFKTIGLESEISIPWDEGVKTFLREGYAGGRVEVFKSGHYQKVNVYDVNSLYPFAMLSSSVPVSDRGEWVSTFNNPECGVFRIEFKQFRKDVPAVLMSNGLGTYEGTGVYFANEISLLREVDPSAIVRVVTGYVFHDTEKVFQNFVNKLYQLRLTDPDGPISLLCKYLLNSLYGKFGQHSEREKIIRVTDPEELYALIPEDGESNIRTLNEANGTHILTSETDCMFQHVGIAGTITSAARCILYRGIMAAGTGNVVYCDTDSVHTTHTLPRSMVGKAIGKFKLENTGEGVYCGKKLYAIRYRNSDGKPVEKVRAKGVSVGGRNGFRLCFDDFLRMLTGEKIACTFQQPKTALQVFKGEQPCRFGPRKRTLKRLC